MALQQRRATIRILLNGLGRDTSPTGICRVAANHASALVQSGLVEHLVLAVGSWQRDMYQALLGPSSNKIDFAIADIKNSSLSRNRWFATEVPRLSRKVSSTIVHCSFPVPVIRSLFPCPVVVTLHDIYPYDLPGNFGFPNYFFNRMVLRQCLNSVDGIACVSNSTKQRLQKIFPKAASRAAVEVTGNYVKISKDGVSSSEISERIGNKNLDILIRGYARLLQSGRVKSQLVIVGAEGPETRLLTELAQSLNVYEQISFLHSINDAELSWLYQHCALFVASSSIEGYCLPVAEALLNHAKVLCSDIPILRDIAAGQAGFFSLQGDAVENLVTAMAAALSGPASAISLDGRFSAETVLAAYIKLYARLC